MFRSNQTPEVETPQFEDTEVEPAMDMADVLEVIVGADGTVEMHEDDGTGNPMMPVVATPELPFGANLVELFAEDELKKIGEKVKEAVETDKESRKEWYETLKKGLQALGVYNPDDVTETGLRRVSHPLILEAATQFQARAMAELLPPGGPVKSTILGKRSPDRMAQADRVTDFMNYQLTMEDRTYYDERDQMLFLLAFTGSEFDKQYCNPTTKKVVSRWVRSDHFIVPYNTSSLETAPRYTHEIHMDHNEYRRNVASGFYSDCCMADVGGGDGEAAPLTEELTKLDGQETPALEAEDTQDHVFYESHIDYDLPGLEEEYALPYVITVDQKTGDVLSIYRNWKEADPLKTKRIWFSHKKFLPGFGFYGFGFLHCIGNLGEAATEILRILLDSGAFATLQGGFKSKDCRMKGDVTLEPGVWLDTEMTADEMQRSFYTPPFKEPSQVMLALLGSIVTAGQKFAATTETMTGDAATTGPVGTMVAQIEQGSKVFSGIHKRLHKGFGDEFIHIAELNGETLPEVYPYMVAGDEQSVLRSDFDGRVDVVPVSDPNIFSSAQRLAMAQTALQLAQGMPDLADRRAAAIGLLEAMRYPNPELCFPKKQEAVRMDPITEGSMVMMGKPIKAYFDQMHQAHLVVHQMQAQQMPPQQQPAMVAHIMEHAAMQQYLTFAQQGLPLPPVEFYPETGEPMYPNLPPQIETQIAMQAAQLVQKMMQQQQAQQAAQEQKPAPQGEDPAQKQALFVQDQQQKDIAAQKEQERKNLALAADVDRKDALAGLSPQLIKEAEQFIAQTGIKMSSRELAVLSKALGKNFTDVVAALSRLTLAGQGGSQFQQTAELMNRDPRFK